MRRLESLTVALLVAALLLGGCAQVKKWAYERGDRDSWQQPARVIDALGVATGSRVADLGSGGGYFTFLLSTAVGPDGHVYAVDVAADMNELVAEEAKRRGVLNVETILARPDDPMLPEDGVDLLFSSNTYHHLGERVAYFARLRDRIRPGGRVAIIEFDPAAHGRHATSPEVIRSEMRQAGYVLEVEHPFLERQSFQIFKVAE